MPKHINIDFNFLDDTKSKKRDTVLHESNNYEETKPTKKYSWKNILIIGGIILFLIWIGSSSENTTTTSTPETKTIGKYTCTQYHFDQASLLEPSINGDEIDRERTALNNRNDQLDSLKSEMDSMGVNDYSSQSEINRFNILVDQYNSKLKVFKIDAAAFESKVNNYNAKIVPYNNYLEKNCTK